MSDEQPELINRGKLEALEKGARSGDVASIKELTHAAERISSALEMLFLDGSKKTKAAFKESVEYVTSFPVVHRVAPLLRHDPKKILLEDLPLGWGFGKFSPQQTPDVFNFNLRTEWVGPINKLIEQGPEGDRANQFLQFKPEMRPFVEEAADLDPLTPENASRWAEVIIGGIELQGVPIEELYTLYTEAAGTERQIKRKKRRLRERKRKLEAKAKEKDADLGKVELHISKLEHELENVSADRPEVVRTLLESLTRRLKGMA